MLPANRTKQDSQFHSTDKGDNIWKWNFLCCAHFFAHKVAIVPGKQWSCQPKISNLRASLFKRPDVDLWGVGGQPPIKRDRFSQAKCEDFASKSRKGKWRRKSVRKEQLGSGRRGSCIPSELENQETYVIIYHHVSQKIRNREMSILEDVSRKTHRGSMQQRMPKPRLIWPKSPLGYSADRN